MHNKKMILAYILIISIVMIAGCQNGTEKERGTAGTQQSAIDNPGANTAPLQATDPQRVMHRTFSIVVPQGWKEVEYKGALVYMPNDGNLSDPFSEKISMLGGFVPENDTRTLAEITATEIAKSKAAIPGLELLSQDDNSRLGQIDAIRVELSMRIQDRTLLTTQLRARQGVVIYAFSIQCEKDKCMHLDAFDSMAKSFEWSNP